MSAYSIACQTLWSFPPQCTVESCPTPSIDSSVSSRTSLPKKLQTVLIDRYAMDSGDSRSSSNQQCSTGELNNAPSTPSLYSHDFGFGQGEMDSSYQQCTDLYYKDVDRKPWIDNEGTQSKGVLSPTDAVSSSTVDMEMDINSVSNKPIDLKEVCQICGSQAAGFYSGAFVCEACKKFYMRACKQSSRIFVCSGRGGLTKGRCVINKTNRTACTYCRFQKCLSVGMEPLGKGLLDTHSIKSLPCKVCGSPSSGFHFGVLTCEGCKGFFRRLLLDGTTKINSLVCAANGNCDVTIQSRSQCRACRYQKCIRVGMSKNAARIGRQPNSVRYARIVENRPTKQEVVADSSTVGSLADIKLLTTTADDIKPVRRIPAQSPSTPHFLDSCTDSYDDSSFSVLRSMPIERTEHPMDLSISCFKSNLFEQHSLNEFSAYQGQISRLANLYQAFCEELYTVNQDAETFASLDDDMAIVRASFLQFQRSLRVSVSFAKKVKGFTLLDMDDRVLLTKCSVYRILLLSWSRKYELDTGKHYMFAWKSWGEVPKRFTDIYPPYRVLDYHFDVIGRKIKSAALSSEEQALLAVLVTINTDNYNDLKNVSSVTRIYNDYKNMLILLTKATQPHPTQRLQELNTLLLLLREAAKEHAVAAKTVLEQYPHYAAVHEQNARVIPALYEEMFTSSPWIHQTKD